jgi:hypothetical protein
MVFGSAIEPPDVFAHRVQTPAIRLAVDESESGYVSPLDFR